MRGIDLNTPITYKNASLRFFGEKGSHVTRRSAEDILLLVFEGVLRFKEDDKIYDVHPGQYYIQEKNTSQIGILLNDSPKYLYVHFVADWIKCKFGTALPQRGSFDLETMKPLAEKLSRMFYNRATMIDQTIKFFEILSKLHQSNLKETLANRIAKFIFKNYLNDLTLETVAEEFNFSKNHIINLFKKEYQMTPFEYINQLKIRQAEQLLEVSSQPVEDICYECGFHNYSYFYRMFHRAHQISPTEYRHQKRMWLRSKVIGGSSNNNSTDIFDEAAWKNSLRTGPLTTVQRGDVLRFEVDLDIEAEEGLKMENWLIVSLHLRLHDYTDDNTAYGEWEYYYCDRYFELEEKLHPAYRYTYRTLTATLDTQNFMDHHMYALTNANGIKAVANNSQISGISGNRVTRKVYRAAIINQTTNEVLCELTGQELFEQLSKDFAAEPIEIAPRTVSEKHTERK